jgi:hypothetical protein
MRAYAGCLAKGKHPARVTSARGMTLDRPEPPGGGNALGRAINGQLLASMLAGGIWKSWTTSRGSRTFAGETIRSPQEFVKLTTQGSPHSKVNIEQTVETIRLSRRALGRNRGRLEP